MSDPERPWGWWAILVVLLAAATLYMFSRYP